MHRTLSWLFFLLILAAGSWAQTNRAARPVILSNDNGSSTQLYQQSHALLIGVSDYRAGWPDLPGVRTDMVLVQAALEENGFEVTVVEDPDSQQLRRNFDQFISLYGRDPDNRLLIYFAGHGHSQLQTYGATMGYLVPADAPDPNDNPNGFLDKALDLQMIEVYSKRIQSKHALFLFDSCFSGELFSPDRAIPKEISLSTSKPVRQYVTSGSAGQTVPDQSIFREQFIHGLGGDADSDQDGYVTGTELGQFLQSTVQNYTKGYQTPQYGKIQDRNLDQGDFVFAVQSDFSRQTEMELEQQVQQAKERLKVANPELREIARFLIDGQRARAGSLLRKYSDREKREKLVAFFAKQPSVVQYELAQVYRKGTGVEADLSIALTWYKEAASRNHPKSQTMLGYLYRNGIGTEADLSQAVNWYQRAAEQGEPTALFNLGSLYRKGYGVPQNEGRALALYREAASKGNAQAKLLLQRMTE